MLYFLIYLFLEVVISVNIATAIGGVMTFVEILFSALVGIVILINFRSTLAENLRAVSVNCIDLKQFQELNLFTLFGAMLLILPGFLTDILGLLFQFTVITRMLVNRFSAKYGQCNTPHQHHTRKDDHVIDVEIVSDDSADKR